MSIKIYEAYRIPIGHINDAIGYFHDAMLSAALKRFDGFVEAHVPKCRENVASDDKVKEEDKNDDCYIKTQATEDMMKLITKVAELPTRTGMDMGAALNVWFHGEYAYLMPIVQFSIIFDDVPFWMEEFGYWNNTDQPDNVTDEEWEARYNIWKQINLGTDELRSSQAARLLTHSAVDFDDMYARINFETRYMEHYKLGWWRERN